MKKESFTRYKGYDFQCDGCKTNMCFPASCTCDCHKECLNCGYPKLHHLECEDSGTLEATDVVGNLVCIVWKGSKFMEINGWVESK